MHANNEVGTIQPIKQISKLAEKHGIILHTDAGQSLGKILTDVDDLGVRLLSIAGHEVYAPKGIGALYIRPKSKIMWRHQQGLPVIPTGLKYLLF